MARVMRQGGPIKNPTAPRLPAHFEQADMARHDIEDDAVIKRVAYSGSMFVNVSAESFELDGCRIEGARFTGSEFLRSQISNSILDACDFAQMRTNDVSLVCCTVIGSRFTGSSWKGGTFRDVSFEGGKGDQALFRESKFYAVTFSDMPMQGADFQKAEMHNVRFRNCDLTGAQFAGLKAGSVRFENCTLVDVGGAASLRGVTVQGPGSFELALSLAREAGIIFE
ncbi:pentapeptide repeat-containing protein [Streptomyces sp. TE33382]